MARSIEDLQSLLGVLRTHNVLAYSEQVGGDVVTIQLAPAPMDAPVIEDQRPGGWKRNPFPELTDDE